MRRSLSAWWPRLLIAPAAIAGLVGLALITQWLAMPVATVEASVPAFQATALPATPVTPSPTPLPLTGPPRRSIVPITPPATPPRISDSPVTATPAPLRATPVTPAAVDVQQVGPALLAEAERQQNMQFNPGAALQKRIFADGFVPNSPEFSLDLDGVTYGGQRAESLRSGVVRVYYVVVPNFANVMVVQRPNARNDAEASILSAGEDAQVIQFNPNAALQKRMFADGFVPNSSEFRLSVDGVTFVGQRGERLDTGEVRVYFVRDGDFANVYYYRRT